MEKNKPIKLRTIFMGSSHFAEKILSGLIEEKYNLIATYTKPDKKIGRNQEFTTGIIKKISLENNIPVFQPEKFNAETIQNLKELLPDIIIVASYGKILPQEVLDISGFGCINVHASLLPKYRGPSPIQNSLLNGDMETGITIMLMDSGIDTGQIISQEKININETDNLPVLFEKLSDLGSRLLLKTLPLWIEGEIKTTKQNDSQATLCQMIDREDGKIIWNDDAGQIFNKFRALTPWPGIFSFWERNRSFLRIKFSDISLIDDDFQDKKSGEVFERDGEVIIKAGIGGILLKKVQMEGKKELTIKEFLNGYRDFIGSILK